jgi:hypothetical protein
MYWLGLGLPCPFPSYLTKKQGFLMTFTSEIATAAEFKKAMARDPGLVFISGVLDGRQVAMTVASVMETTNEAVIYGPKKNWRAYIRNADGTRFTARPKFETYVTLPFAKKRGRQLSPSQTNRPNHPQPAAARHLIRLAHADPLLETATHIRTG